MRGPTSSLVLCLAKDEQDFPAVSGILVHKVRAFGAIPGNVPRVRRSRILSVSAAVAAVTLSVTPGVAVAKPVDKRSGHGVVAFPLLALHKSDHATPPYSHSSHSSHASHSSHYSGSHSSHASHNSHSSHISHYSSSPTTPPPSPPPPSSAAPSQSSAPTHRKVHVHRHHGHGHAAKVSSSPSPTTSSQSPTPTATDTSVSPQPTGNDSSGGGGDVALEVIVGLAALGGGTYYVYRRNRRPR